MSEIGNKRDLMEITNRLIPLMNEDEVLGLALAIHIVIQKMVERGAVIEEE